MIHSALAIADVLAERERQDVKWGEQNHDPARWLMILGEEYGEACKAGCDLTWPNPQKPRCMVAEFRAELVQVAAVAVAMIECIDRNSKKGGGA